MWLGLLIAVLAFAAGWVGCAIFGIVTESSCRRGDIDLTYLSRQDRAA